MGHTQTWPLLHSGDPRGRLAERLFSAMDPEFGRLSRRTPASSEEGASRPALWFPSADVHESDEAVTFHCDLPGLKKEDVQVLGGVGGVLQQVQLPVFFNLQFQCFRMALL